MDDYELLKSLVLAQGPINRYVVLNLPGPLPEYTFTVPTPIRPSWDGDIEVLKLRYRLVHVIGTACIYEYVGWTHECIPEPPEDRRLWKYFL